MMDDIKQADRIVEALKNNSRLVTNVSLETFRDVYNRIKHPSIIWLVTFMGDQAYAQLYGIRNVYLIIRSRTKGYLVRSDLSFIPDEELQFFGTSQGRYSFTSFINDVYSRNAISLLCCAYLTISLFIYVYSKSSAIVIICNAIIQAMSIFIAVFVTFVISANSENYYKYFKSGRFHILAQSDKYIGAIAISSIFFAILDVVVATSFELPTVDIYVWNVGKACQSVLASSAIITASLSFGLMLDYHFDRRNEMITLELARTVLNKHQDLFTSGMTNDTERS